MANRQNQLLASVFVLLAGLPAQAQEVALEQQANSSLSGSELTNPQHRQMQVNQQAASAAAGSGSYLKHWSRFSQTSSTSPFVRVPAGTQCRTQASISHYIRPQRIEPGSVQASTQTQNGPVKRYLAYNVPAGTGSRKITSIGATATQIAKTAKRNPIVATAAFAGKTANTHAMALGYGSRIGEVTYTPISAHWSGTTISAYGRYH